MKVRESKIEDYLRQAYTAAGDLCYKFTSPARRSVPDRLCLRAIPPEHRALVARYVQFVEVKATGQVPTEAQAREHDRLRKLGFRVEVVDSYEMVDQLLVEKSK